MLRTFKTADYEATLDLKVALREALPPDHLARFITHHRQDAYTAFIWSPSLILAVSMRASARVEVSPTRPRSFLPCLCVGTARASSAAARERATFESLPFRFIAGDWHPDHDTLANFRQSFLKEIKALFIEVLLLAQALGVLYRRPAYDVCLARRQFFK
jgi:hypothetical protein